MKHMALACGMLTLGLLVAWSLRTDAADPADTHLTAKPTDADRKVLKMLQETIVSFTFNEQPVMEAIDFLQALGNVNIVRDRGKFARPEPKVTLKLKNVSLDTAIKLLTEQIGLTYVIRDGAVVITDEKGIAEEPVTVIDGEAGEAVDFLRKVAPVRFGRLIIGENTRDRPVTLRVRNMKLRYALNWTARFGEAAWSVRDTLLVISDEREAK